MKTKAAILYQLNKPLVIEEIEIPKLKKGQVLVKILATGLCRTQLNEIKGLKGPDQYLPHLLGHEGCGEVIKLGQGITRVKKGDYVVTSWVKGPGLEGLFSQYKRGNKTINAGPITTFSHYSIISENRLTKIPKKVPKEVAVVLGCAAPTGMGIIRHTLKVASGSTIAIFGVGGIGTSAILGAKMKKCRQIIAVDIREDKLQFAKSLGATHTLGFDKNKIISAVKRIFNEGVDYAVEASGTREAMETAFEVLKDKGKLVIAGNLQKGEKIFIDPFDLIKGKRIIGTWGGETNPDEDIPYYAKLYLSGELELDKLITRKFRLEEINTGLSLMEKNDFVGRMIIEF